MSDTPESDTPESDTPETHLAEASSASAAPSPVFAPDILAVPEDWRDRTSWQFESFVLHRHTDVCQTCASVTHYSNVFRMFTRHHPAAVDRRLVPATRVPEELSVIFYSMPERQVPLCHNCLSESRITATRILVTSEAEWNEARRRSLETRRQTGTGTSSTSRPQKSLDDLLGL